jgi:hypothetical protein
MAHDEAIDFGGGVCCNRCSQLEEVKMKKMMLLAVLALSACSHSQKVQPLVNVTWEKCEPFEKDRACVQRYQTQRGCAIELGRLVSPEELVLGFICQGEAK